MVKKKATSKTKTHRVYVKAKKTRRAKSGVTMIPSAMATVGLVAVNYKGISKAWDYVRTSSASGSLVKGTQNLIMGTGAGAKNVRNDIIGKDALIKDAIAIGGGYLAGEVVRRYAPRFIKSPAGKLAKKIPKVI